MTFCLMSNHYHLVAGSTIRGKLQIAMRLRKETTLTVKQIAERLALGTSKSASRISLLGCRSIKMIGRIGAHLSCDARPRW